MSIAPYLKEIGRGKEGARHLTREQAADLMAAVLDGRVSDVELGGFALAMRIKGESPDELAGFLDVCVPRRLAGDMPAGLVTLPSYNGARKLPNLTTLLAHLLAREGVPVLVHGPLAFAGRVSSAEVFAALGHAPVTDLTAARAAWDRHEPVFMDIATLHPSLAKLLALRHVLGLRNSGHTLAKLLPVGAAGATLRVVNYTHPEYLQSLSQLLALTGGDAVLMRGTEGEPVADARRAPRMDVFLGGVRDDALSNEPQDGVLRKLPELPGIDAAATAAYIRTVLDGAQPVPEPIAKQVDCLLATRRAMAARSAA